MLRTGSSPTLKTKLTHYKVNHGSFSLTCLIEQRPGFWALQGSLSESLKISWYSVMTKVNQSYYRNLDSSFSQNPNHYNYGTPKVLRRTFSLIYLERRPIPTKESKNEFSGKLYAIKLARLASDPFTFAPRAESCWFWRLHHLTIILTNPSQWINSWFFSYTDLPSSIGNDRWHKNIPAQFKFSLKRDQRFGASFKILSFLLVAFDPEFGLIEVEARDCHKRSHEWGHATSGIQAGLGLLQNRWDNQWLSHLIFKALRNQDSFAAEPINR